MLNRKKIGLSIFIGLILIIAACSGSSSQPTDDSDNEVRVVKVFMLEFSFSPSVIDVEVGETVKLIVVNDGVALHEFEIATHHEIDEHLAGGHAGHQEDNGVKKAEGLRIELEPGQTGELTVTFDNAQELFFVCLLPGHYEAGMVGKFNFGEEHEDDGHSEEADDGHADENNGTTDDDHEEHEDEH